MSFAKNAKRALFAALSAATINPAQADDLRMRFYDGDTIGPTMRLTIDGDLSFDAPETTIKFGAECELEVERGIATQKRLQEIRDEADYVALIPLLADDGSIARDGTGQRLLVRMLADGENVGLILEGEGHVLSYDWRTEKVDHCHPNGLRRVKK